MAKSSPKPPAKKTAQSAKKQVTTSKKPSKARLIRQPRYKSFRLSKRIKTTRPRLGGSIRRFWSSLGVVKRHWKLFGGISLVYLVLTVVLVKGGGSSLDVTQLKDLLGQTLKTGSLATGLTIFGVLIGNADSAASAVAASYQSMLLVTVSLAVIWALRQTTAGIMVGVRDAFYKGLYPLAPFLLVILAIGVQLIPLLLSTVVYGAVFRAGLAVAVLEKALWLLLMFLLVLWTLYMITASIFSLYIVTLPDMRPMRALRSARDLVRYRRWTVMRKVLFLPFALLLTGAVIMLPVILLLPVIAEWVFFALTMMALVVVHAYMYSLYRELL